MIFYICFLKFWSLQELQQNKLSCCFLQLIIVMEKALNRKTAPHSTSSKQHIKINFWRFFASNFVYLAWFEKNFSEGSKMESFFFHRQLVIQLGKPLFAQAFFFLKHLASVATSEERSRRRRRRRRSDACVFVRGSNGWSWRIDPYRRGV